jgi:hypothetical protein
MHRPFVRGLIGALAAVGILFLTWPGKAIGAEADDPKWCRVCHRQERFSAARMSRSVHGSFPCRTCHIGYHFNPHEPVEVVPGPVAGVGGQPSRASGALAACALCHADVAQALQGSPHARSSGDGAPLTPYCLDCHGDPHAIPRLSDEKPGHRREVMNKRCEACHGDAVRMQKVGLSTYTVESYEDSMHARKLHLGSERAPGCADCHGSHALNDLGGSRVKICGACHKGAGETFASLAMHLPLTRKDRPVGYYTQKLFAWLTFVTILFLALHVLLDVLASIRNVWRGRRG